MAVYLAETAVHQTAVILRAHLATELATIDTEKSDGITTPKPETSDIFEYLLEEHPMDRDVLIEVGRSGVRFGDWVNATLLSNRADSHTNLVVRITVKATDAGESPADLNRKLDRVIAAVYRILAIDHYDLDGNIAYLGPESDAISYRDTANETQVAQATLRLIASVSEVNT